ncbi:unnamed protein product [Calypogeia fissa]
MSADGWSVLVKGGAVVPTSPGSASTFLRSTAPGAYTTTRTVSGAASVLLWERHLARLAESLQLLSAASPHHYPSIRQDLDVKRLVQPSVRVGLAEAMQRRRAEEEIALTVLLCGNKLIEATAKTESGCEVYIHASNYNAVGEGKMPLAINVAVMGPGRTLARVKNSLWASTRQVLERVRPAGTSEIILSNDGDSLLEGTLTNFFVVARRTRSMLKDTEDSVSTVGQEQSGSAWNDLEVQTAPLQDGVLPGVIRSMVIEVCRESGIPLREVAPSWRFCHTWREAFVTSSIRILQPVVKIQMPTIRTFELSPWNLAENSWEHLKLEECGLVTRKIHELLIERAKEESISIADITGW